MAVLTPRGRYYCLENSSIFVEPDIILRQHNLQNLGDRDTDVLSGGLRVQWHFELLVIVAGYIVEQSESPGVSRRSRVRTPLWHSSFKETKYFFPAHSWRFNILGNLRDRKVAGSASDRQGLNFEFRVWRVVSSHHPQEVLLAQLSLHVYKDGLKPHSFFSREDILIYSVQVFLFCYTNTQPFLNNLREEDDNI